MLHEEIIGLHRADPAHRVPVHFHVDRLIHEIVKRDGGLAAGPAYEGVVLDGTGVVLVHAVVSAAELEREVPANRAAYVQAPSRGVRLIQGILFVRRAERIVVGVEGIQQRAVGAVDRVGLRPDAGTLPDAVAADVDVEDTGQDAVEVALAKAAATSSFIPRLSIVSIIPGIDTLAPDLTETSNGLLSLPNFLLTSCSNLLIYLCNSSKKLAVKCNCFVE